MARVALGVATAAVALATLVPSRHADATQLPLLCLWCGQEVLADSLVNVALYLPLGVAMRQCKWGMWRIFATLAALSGAIELTQHWIPGRTPSPRDLLTNVTGGIAGSLLLAAWRTPPGASGPGRVLRYGTALLPAIAVLTTARLLALHIPNSQLYSHLGPRLAHLDSYQGSITAVRVGRSSLSHGASPESGTLGAHLSQGAEIRIEGVAGGPQARLAGLLLISDDSKREILLVGREHDDLVVRRRRLASALGLHSPEERMRDFFQGVPPGTALTVTVQRGRLRSCASTGRRSQCSDAPSIGWGWRFVHEPPGIDRRIGRALDGLALYCLLLPLCLLLARRSGVLVFAPPEFLVTLISLAGAAWTMRMHAGTGLPEALALGAATLTPFLARSLDRALSRSTRHAQVSASS